jgi:type I restriction enzyme S subunit
VDYLTKLFNIFQIKKYFKIVKNIKLFIYSLDNIVININKQIEALKELRKTLINDVVTGKIKVVDN